MGKGDLPDPLPTPAPRAQGAGDEVASDLMEEVTKKRKGRKASFLTTGQRLETKKKPANSLLGTTDTLG